jgi:hypothetical protein
MSDYRNYRINSITIPEIDDNDEVTGINLTLEVISQEILNKTTNVYEGGSIQQQEIVFVCFVNMPDRPKKLLIINPNDFDEIIIKGYTHESKKSWNSGFAPREKSNRDKRNTHTGDSIGGEQNP